VKHVHDFLLVEEGYTQYGYLPLDKKGNPIGKSGLTIGAGVDVGQMNRHEFNEMPMSATARHQLTPFVGVQGVDAKRLLDSRVRVTITVADAEAISNYVFNTCVERVATKWKNFRNLPEQAQTVLVSLAYNLGLGGSPSTSRKIAEQQFSEAAAELRNPDEWANRELDGRRNREATLLEEILS
jgi:GH24 family phage-related lysozyme (muramidase)